MARQIAIQMDPISGINIKTDTTFLLGLEAQKRGHLLFYYQPQDLFLKDLQLYALAYPIWLKSDEKNYFGLGDPIHLDLATVDVILMRQDPPFNMAYITATHLLDLIADKTTIINSPSAVRNAPEKLSILQFKELTPHTLISASGTIIQTFIEEQKDIILKPLYACGGTDVFRVKRGDTNTTALIDILLSKYQLPLIAQTYIPEVTTGDKRVILIDGEPAGAILRVPKTGETRANLHVGGTAIPTQLTPQDQRICNAIKPYLKDNGLFLAGIDIIGNYLTEINVTSPTGFHEINHLNGASIEQIFWDKLELKLA